ncbi:4'-phosphopantetheinyl transferase superfamily protein [Brevibacillus laterosporus]|uniref:4'-phosphopantetheinyl transferase family protein n=1 Tax=Brevibacillus laterosporus TaxID=1465 RepID=UPI0003710CDD|nr:4'-phosphopantetheinyl transferase superfamily protein [Brevibacillus laterosporus]ATO47645.1 4-phosphopantetheinyl transferase [Brevibacillus laterosporus DSM 25]MBG9804725.1 4-phosphopantetheinyl transferase [Brevibacillus laterosporus]MED2002627.1 4'-phosphopantetheinyl transferase superfamily protein [Brevibacillus laterosporus]MED4762020.1 4'-phosphopantetheinyl transferase superfamily protein [Brevibacillus laterosporus]TPH23063.1 4'-phosphopantetheinyl transferase superfamily protein
MKVFAIKVPDTYTEELYRELLSLLPFDRQEKVNRYLKTEDKWRSLLGEVLVRVQLAQRMRLLPKEIRYETNAYGKPFVTGEGACEFNVSHSASWVVTALSAYPIGIDVQQIKPINLQIADRFFSEQERQDLFLLPEADQLECFFRYWAYKESYIKAVGKGLSLPLDSFTIQYKSPNRATVYADQMPTGYHCRAFHVDEMYKIAVCTKKDQFCEQITIVEMEELASKLLQT